MGLANLAHFVSLRHRLVEVQEDLSQNGLMSLDAGLNTVSRKIEHIAFIVFCLEKRRMLDMILLLKMVGMDSIECKGQIREEMKLRCHIRNF